jgi:cation-transporting ATPase E
MFFATVTFALGILRMASRGVLVQQINALDRLPSVTAVCIDKTGTLTTSELEVTCVVPCCGEPEAAGSGHLLAAFAAATSEPNATVAALARLDDVAGITPLDELPFRSELKMSAVRFAEHGVVRTLLFGGFDVLAHRLSPEECERVETIFEREQLAGLRTLLLLELTELEGPLSVETVAHARHTPLCIVAMSDRIRDDAAVTLDRLAGEGVDVKILSGDAPDSVAAVMGAIGWRVTEDQVIAGDAFHAMSAEARARAALADRIFARLTPEQKREIVRALRDAGTHVAMIGDGMNDLIALKEADVGITMGEGIGSGDIILIERRFDLIRECIAEGSRVIGTVVAVARLFLVKTLVIAAMSALTWSGLVLSPLTPRRGSLVSLLGVALPSYLVAAVFVGETGAHRVRERIVGFVLLSSVVIVLAGIVGGHLFAAVPGATPDGVAAGVMVTLVLVSVASALSAVIFDDRARRRTYLLVMALLLVLYLPLVATDVDAGPIGWVRTFYEIDPVPGVLWAPVALVIAVASVLLVTVQWLRHRREAAGR